jgi:hypothetical protein
MRTLEGAGLQIDLKRRGFLFGAAATLIVPPPRTFHIITKAPLIIPVQPFDLPLQQLVDLMKRLDDKAIQISAIPRWLVIDQAWYDSMLRAEASA